MALQARLWVMAGSLLLALAQPASAQSVVPGEVLDVPVSTRLLMTFHDRAAGPWYLADTPMSTRLLRSFRSETAAIPGGFGRHYGSFLPYQVRPTFSAPRGWALGTAAPAPKPDSRARVDVAP